MRNASLSLAIAMMLPACASAPATTKTAAASTPDYYGTLEPFASDAVYFVLTDRFVKEAAMQGLDGLKGHRNVGGIRASTYNAMPLQGCKALADFMREFERRA